MDKEQIFEMAIRELTERALEIRRENLSESESKLHEKFKALDENLQSIMSDFTETQRNIVEDFIDAKDLIADDECMHLYVQGAKDVIALLKKLDAL